MTSHEAAAPAQTNPRSEQARLVWKSPWPPCTNVVSAAVICAVVWDSTAHQPLLAWFGATTLVVLIRVGLFLWQRFQWPGPAPRSSRFWLRAHTLGTATSACLWGLAVWLVFAEQSFAVHVFLAVVIAGMGAGAVTTNAVYLPALYAYLVPSTAPLALAFLLRDEPLYPNLALLTVLFITTMLVIGHYFNRWLHRIFALQDHNQALIGQLESAREQLESEVAARNADLTAEVAERKMTEKALRQALEAAVVADQAKSEFLANMNHELRTPLNAILAFAEIIKDQLLGPVGRAKYADYAGLVYQAGQDLLSRISDIMELARLDHGDEKVRDKLFELPDLLRDARDAVKMRAENVVIELAMACPAHPPKLRADRDKLKQVLVHLLSNAIKFTAPGGRVVMNARCSPESGCSIEISDSGIGIAADDMAKVLTPFVQADGRLQRRHGGIGLGLSLAKSLIELHGGTLELHSKVGIGTQVLIHLPAERVETTHLAPVKQQALG